MLNVKRYHPVKPDTTDTGGTFLAGYYDEDTMGTRSNLSKDMNILKQRRDNASMATDRLQLQDRTDISDRVYERESMEQPESLHDQTEMNAYEFNCTNMHINPNSSKENAMKIYAKWDDHELSGYTATKPISVKRGQSDMTYYSVPKRLGLRTGRIANLKREFYGNVISIHRQSNVTYGRSRLLHSKYKSWFRKHRNRKYRYGKYSRFRKTSMISRRRLRR